VTALTPEGLEPLAVWDTYDPHGFWRGPIDDRADLMLAAADWAGTRIERTADTFRVEFYLFDMPFAVVTRHMRDEGGRLVWNPDTRRPYEEEPVIVPLDELPPEHLLKAA
jgi:hypothetical protein